MSNNIYDILKKMQNLEAPKQTITEGKKSKPDFLDLNNNGNKKEPMKKAAKDKSKGAIAEAVARVEQQLAEKYMGFKNTVAAIEKGGSAKNPEAVAAAIGRDKYGKKKFQKAAAAGKKLREDEVDLGPTSPEIAAMSDDEVNAALRLGTSPDFAAMSDDEVNAQFGGGKYSKLDKDEYNEDMLSPKQKKFAALAKPKDKITYADKIAGAKKGVKKEGNKFSGNLMKARAQGLKRADLDGDGDMEPVREGWDEMLKAQKERSGPQPSGGSGIKRGTRYGGGRQTDEPDTDNETGEVAKKGRGRPKKDKFAK